LRVAHAVGVEGGRGVRGTAVLIDVLRAYTVSAYALAGGALECRLVATVEEARDLAGRLPGAVIAAEVDGLPVEGIVISNSPTMVRDADLRGRTLVQRSSQGVQGALAADAADRRYAASLVVAGATARALRAEGPELVTLVSTGAELGHQEDRACADYIDGLLGGSRPDLDELLAPLYRSERYRELVAGGWPGFPASDLELALDVDRFEFAMLVERDDIGLRLTGLAC
jgi:2-phosphosulfolactate phosphatase